MTNMKNDADRRTIYGRFAAMARRHPDAVAIIEDGRRLPDRGFAFLRRNDDQVMILGRRVETGEVENVLNESPDNPTGRCAYLMIIYVRKPYRRRGLGAAITRHLVEQARWHRCGKIYLESSDMASALYGSLGFRPMAHMMQAR